MLKSGIKKKYQIKLAEFNKHNKLYYNKSKPIISDSEFDDLKKEIIELENKYKFLKSKKSPSTSIGYKPSKSFEKYKHKMPMLSLSNAFDKDDLLNFEKKIYNYLNKNINFEYSVEPKIDGISASLTYKNNKLAYGVSRGDGNVGEIITENLKTIRDIPLEIKNTDFPDEIEIRGEVFIKKKDFLKIKENFANPRNAASGTLRQKDPNETKKIPLNFIAYTFGFVKQNNIKYQSEFLKALKSWGFQVNKENKVIKTINELIEFHTKFEDKRFDLEYDVDGLVYKVNDLNLQSRLGFTSNSPRWAIAHKFSADSAYTKIINIDIQVGRTGALTPVAKVEPINIGGVIVSNATLHNEDEIERKDIRVGDVVKIERAGDVIPHVIEVDKNLRSSKTKKFSFPIKCPSCGSNTTKEYNKTTKKYDAVRRCTNEGYECERIAVEKIKHFISKDALNIDGLGKKVVEKFWDLNLIKEPQDIFRLNYKKIEQLEGWGKLSVNNLKLSIEKSKKVTLQRLIYSIGIRHIGIENAKLISDNVKNISNLIEVIKQNNFDKFLSIDGIGETQVNSLKSFFSNQSNINIIIDLKKVLDIESQSLNKNGILRNKTFMFTGKLEGMSRAEAKSLIEKNAGVTLSGVSKNLNYLIIGDKPTKKKIDQAKKLGIKILSQRDLKELLN
tara:strand:+ start:6588 stop:8600 length:2013 start_codon:yes stop_codon:yes gene_type:complete